ncbi:hypothetical protein GCM10027289_00040 [Tsukamurella serpentis]
MGYPDEERIREQARERIADRPNMVLDGGPIEELARAHERHAERLNAIVDSLGDVGRRNFLGDTTEGRAATHNLGVAVHDHDLSLVRSVSWQAEQATMIAQSLRQIAKDLEDTELQNVDGIGEVRWD